MTLACTHIADLTHCLTSDFPSYDGSAQLTVTPLATLDRDGWNYGAWTLAEHIGTHFDAPRHRSHGPAADEVPADQLIGPLVVVDIRAKAACDADATLDADDLLDWEKRHGRLPPGAVVALFSGWETHLATARFRNADAAGGLHFPGFALDAVEWLLRQRAIVGLAVDTLSLDPGASQDFPVHTAWLGAGRWGLECLANLALVPSIGATVFVGAPKVAGASGGPARVLAVW
jgi:kynurenine formamidase